MKKKIFTMAITLLVFTVAGYAQIPNNGFETWSDPGTGPCPDGWICGNNSSVNFLPIVQTTGYKGTFAMKATVVDLGGGQVQGGTALLQFASTLRPKSLTGYYHGTFVANDSATILVTIGKGGTGIGAGVKYFSTNQSTFKYFSIPLNYGSSNNPDSIAIAVFPNNRAPFIE